MSEEQPPPSPYSQPASTGGMFLRIVLIGGVVLAGIVGIVWYASRPQ